MSESRKSSSKNPRLRLVDFKSDDERPAIRVYAVDRSFGVIDSALVGEDGAFNLASSAFEKAHQIVIGPDTQSLGEVDREHLLVYRPEQFRDSIADRVLEIPSPIWQQWHFIIRCVTGTVRRCYPYPWYIRDLTVQANTVNLPKQRITETRALTAKAAALDNISIVKPIFPPYFNCKTICNGTVEVYRRVCCCEPWIVYDPRLSDLI
ncbi:MAG: hypothetical protein K8L99_13070, partial [Anaerolineae bacterium]|nr:hypothetical protein [Anaerolineae bacterium]